MRALLMMICSDSTCGQQHMGHPSVLSAHLYITWSCLRRFRRCSLGTTFAISAVKYDTLVLKLMPGKDIRSLQKASSSDHGKSGMGVAVQGAL